MEVHPAGVGRAWKCRFAWVVATALACSLLTTSGTIDARAAVVRQTITPNSDCERGACEIVLTKLVTLSAKGHSLHNPVPFVVQDRSGRYLARGSTGRQIVAFDRAGGLLAVLDPPDPSPRAVVALLHSPSGSAGTWVGPSGDAYLITQDFKLTPWFRVPYQPRFIRPDGTMVVAQQIQTPALIGYPLHLVSANGTVLRSFGTETPEYRADLRLFMERVVAPATDDSVWESPKGRYVLGRWNPVTGQRLSRTAVRSSWFVESADYPRDNRTKPRPIVEAIWERDHVIWSLIRDADSQWKPGADPEQSWSPDRYSSEYDWVLEVIDPKSGTVLVSRRFPFALVGRPPQPLVVSFASAGGNTGGGLDVWLPEVRRKEARQ